MKQLIIVLSLGLSLTACNNEQKEEQSVVLDTYKSKLSYCLGAEQANMILKSGDPNLNKFNFEKVQKGFETGLEDSLVNDPECTRVIQNLVGPYGQDFDTNYVEEASFCIGKISGSIFLNGWLKKGGLDKMDMEFVKVGYQHALQSKDSLISRTERAKLVNDFMADLNKSNGIAMLNEAKKQDNAIALDNGIVIKTLEEGKGGSPNENDDVKVDYILMSSIGDTLENSLEYRQNNPGMEMPGFNLNQVIKGWKIAFPLLKKGGRYMLYIPHDLAYGAQNNYESLCFYVEFHDFGAAGSLSQR